MLKGRVCSKGLWDESVPGISFDDQGVSNYARIFERMLADFPRGETGIRNWETAVKEMRSQGKNKNYDCIVGLSGGTDSCFLLHLAKEYGLRPLAVNLDNGWSSDIAVKNIKKMTQALGIDLETYVIDYEEVTDVLKAYLRAGLPWADSPTDLAIRAVLYKKAAEEGLTYILIGHDFRSEGFQPTEWTYSDDRQMRHLAAKFSRRRLKTYPSLTLWSFGWYSFVRKIKYYKPFFYLHYNKAEAKQLLREKYGWQDYGGHHYENIYTRFIISYWLYKKFGIDKRKITLSAQVVSGALSREEALREIKHQPFDPANLDSDIEYLCKKLQMNHGEFDRIFNSRNHSFSDYPSYYPLYRTFRKMIFPAIRFFVPNKPLLFYQIESRKTANENPD